MPVNKPYHNRGLLYNYVIMFANFSRAFFIGITLKSAARFFQLAKGSHAKVCKSLLDPF